MEDYLELPVVELPAWRVVVAVVTLDTHACSAKSFLELDALVGQLLSLDISKLSRDAARNHDHLLQQEASLASKQNSLR